MFSFFWFCICRVIVSCVFLSILSLLGLEFYLLVWSGGMDLWLGALQTWLVMQYLVFSSMVLDILVDIVVWVGIFGHLGSV